MPDTGRSPRNGFTPYQDLPPESFWRSGVAEPGPFGMTNLVRPKYSISRQDRIITLGSCFAQRLSQSLMARGYNWVDAEPAPPSLSEASKKRFNYGVFTFRTGNIYTSAVLRQWISWAFDKAPPPETWPENGRLQDATRPEIEPGGFLDESELTKAWNRTLSAIRQTFSTADVFVFTMGLTEAWRNRENGLVYPSCPGTVAGQFDADRHELVNFEYEEVRADLKWCLEKLRQINPGLRVILTVSPVPLTATAEPDSHALVANTYTKSLLRTVAGSLSRGSDCVDYFPGYEMVATPPFRGMFYAPNMRSVDMFGVRYVMDSFVAAYSGAEMLDATAPQDTIAGDANDLDLSCADYVLDFYSDR